MLRRPPRLPLFPYTTLFRSDRFVLRELCPHFRVLGFERAQLSAEALVLRHELFGELGPAFTEERSEEHTTELQSRQYLVSRLLLKKYKNDSLRIVSTARDRA